MPKPILTDNLNTRHTDEMQDIITKVPSWIMRWGITLFFGILFLIVGLSVLIRYPDVIKTTIKIGTPVSYGRVISNVPGKVSKILVHANDYVKSGQELMYVEDPGSKKITFIAPIAGRITFVGVIHENDRLLNNQEVFYIDPGNSEFFGEMVIPQNSIGDIKEGQNVIIKLQGYPYEQYGILKGKIRYLADNPGKQDAFHAEVVISRDPFNTHKEIQLKPGMLADAEIITRDATVFSRIARNLNVGVMH